MTMDMAASFGNASNFSISHSTFTHVAGSQHNYNIGDQSDFDVIPSDTGAIRPNDLPNGRHPLPPQRAHQTLDSSNPAGIEAAPDTLSRHRRHGRQQQRESHSSTIDSTPPHSSYSEARIRRSTVETLNSPQRQDSGPLSPERTSNHAHFAAHPPLPRISPETDPNIKLNPLRMRLLEKLGEEVSGHPQSRPGPILQSLPCSASSAASGSSTLLDSVRLEVLQKISDSSSDNPRQPTCSRKSTGSTLSPPSTPTTSCHPKQKPGEVLSSYCLLQPQTQKSSSPPLAEFELLKPPKPSHPLPLGCSNPLLTPPPSRPNYASVHTTPVSPPVPPPVPPPPPPPLPSGHLHALPTPPLSASPTSITHETPALPAPSPPPLPPRPPQLMPTHNTLNPKPQYQPQNINLDTSIRSSGAPNSTALPPLPRPSPSSLPISPTASETAASVHSPRAPWVAPNGNADVAFPMSPTVGRPDSLGPALQSPVLITGRPLQVEDAWLDDGRMVGSPLPLQYGLFGDHKHTGFRGHPYQAQLQPMHTINHQLTLPFRSSTAPQAHISPYAQGPTQTQAQSQDTYIQDMQAHTAARHESYDMLWRSDTDPASGFDPLAGHGPVFGSPLAQLPLRPPAPHQHHLSGTHHTPAMTATAPSLDAWVPQINGTMLNRNEREHYNGRDPSYTLPVSTRYDQGPPPVQPGPQVFYVHGFGAPY